MEEQLAGFWLSPQQKLAWTAQQSGVSARAVSMIMAEGRLRQDKLRNAFEALVNRHEVLRTVFQKQPGMKVPFQVILNDTKLAWEDVDLSGMDADAQKKQLEQLFCAEIGGKQDLGQLPNVRVAVAKMAENRHAILLSTPSVSCDRQSLNILVGELASVYAGNAPTDEPLRYVQFAQWQGDLLESNEEDALKAREFWRHFDHPALALPHEIGRESENFSRGSVVIAASPADQAKLNAIGQDAITALIAAWQVVLWRLSGQAQVNIGVSSTGRGYEELENAVGVFAKSLPTPACFEGDLRFSEVMAQVNKAIRDAAEVHEHYVLGQGFGHDDPVSFEYVQLPAAVVGGEVRFEVVEQEVMLDRCKLRLVAERRGSELRLRLDYDGSRFAASAVELIAGYFHSLMAAAVANPETPVSRLPLLNAEQRQQILHSWNQTAAEYPRQCLHELFEAQAARTPQRPAVQFEDRTLSYCELNQQSNRLAHYLRSLGVGPDCLVGLCLERSAEMMVVMLGVLKAGGAYVPLNADNPKPRLAQQLAGAVALITEAKLAAQMPEFSGKTLCIDRDQALWAQQPDSNPENRSNPDHLVYVIYTSGSTGVPKGVAVRHRNLVNYAHFITRRLQLERFPEGLHFATVSTLGADLGNTCIFPALISGGCVQVISYEVSTDSQRFASYCERHPVDVLKIVPSHLQALLGPSDAGAVLPRKFLITGGESLTEKLMEKIESFHPGCELLNHYGPTETTVGSLTLRLKEYGKRSGGSSIPIGKPIANTRIYILDQHLEPVPVGVVGELYIGGAGVTAGYLNQPEKTAERFLGDPFVKEAGAKMYRTGDLARYQEDGNVEFLGRGDDQVKIRGFRIELGEIEAVLGKHAGVKQAVVLAREDESGEKRLVGYVVLQREASVSMEQLRGYLKEQLPDYMVPAAMVSLAKLPLNANGKIDRQALPAPEQAQSKTYVPPRTPTEEVLAAIWSEVLRKDRISIKDNFFELGGHSLMATQIVSRVREQFKVELGLRVLFEKPTISGLAEAIVEAEQGGCESEEPSIVPVRRESYRAGQS